MGTYQPKVYRRQGGDELVVASGGTITVESGGLLNVGSAAIAANDDTLTVTAALHAGRVIQFGKTSGTTVTLPAATGTGNVYRFVIGVTATSNANVIQVANDTDVMAGSLNIQQDTNVDGTYKVWRADASDDYMSFAGAATTGGIVGGYIECLDYKTGYWQCRAYTQSGGGSEASPFAEVASSSASVSMSPSDSPSVSVSDSPSASPSLSPSSSESVSASVSDSVSASPSASS